MRSLSSILGRSDGHAALLELLMLREEVARLKEQLGDAYDCLLNDERLDDLDLDEIIPNLSRAVCLTVKLSEAYDALG